VLRKFNNQVFIESGLMPGDQVLASPLPGAVDGMAVTVKPADNRKTSP
jgi:hypothetical protein